MPAAPLLAGNRMVVLSLPGNSTGKYISLGLFSEVGLLCNNGRISRLLVTFLCDRVQGVVAKSSFCNLPMTA